MQTWVNTNRNVFDESRGGRDAGGRMAGGIKKKVVEAREVTSLVMRFRL